MTRREALAFAAAAPLAGEAGDLVQAVVSRYRDADRAYAAVARVHSTTGGPMIGGWSAPALRAVQKRDGLYRVETRLGDRWLFVRGQQDSWIYRSDRNQYRQGANASDVAAEVERFGQSTFAQLGGRFAHLGKLSAATRATGKQDVKVSGRRIVCAVISIHPTQELWTEKLWIDPATGLIWKSLLHTPESARKLSRSTTIEWNEIAIGERIPDEAFDFVPPPGARRVENFPRQPLAEPPPLRMPNDTR